MELSALERFRRRLLAIDNTRKRLEKLHADGHMQRRDLLSAYESLYMRSVVSFERFCETLFLDILNQRVRYPRSQCTPRIKKCSGTVLRDVILQNKKYMDWLPYNNTETRAKIYLVKGRPFTNLKKAEKAPLEGILTIRNAIAHSSPHALRQFRLLIEGMPLLPKEKNPAGFLRSPLTVSPLRTRFEGYLAELELIAIKINGSPIKRRRTK
jgi:hypothetical protein